MAGLLNKEGEKNCFWLKWLTPVSFHSFWKKKCFQNRPSINLPQKRTKTKNTIVHVEEFAKKCLVTENSYTVQTRTQSWSLAGTTAVTTFKYIYIQKLIKGKMMLNISFNEILPENISLAIKHDAFYLKVHSVVQRCKKQDLQHFYILKFKIFKFFICLRAKCQMWHIGLLCSTSSRLFSTWISQESWETSTLTTANLKNKQTQNYTIRALSVSFFCLTCEKHQMTVERCKLQWEKKKKK